MNIKQVLAVLIVPVLLTIMGCENKVSTTPLSPVGPELTSKKITSAAASKQPRVSVCHLTGDGSYQEITINGNALEAHLDHGDAMPGSGGLDESCQEVQVPEDVCPCFDGADLAALDLTFGGSHLLVSGYENTTYTTAYGMNASFTTRFVFAGANPPGTPYVCHLFDGVTGERVKLEGITEAEAESCRQVVREAWPDLF